MESAGLAAETELTRAARRWADEDARHTLSDGSPEALGRAIGEWDDRP